MMTFTTLPVNCMAKGATPMAVMARTMAHDGVKAARRNRTTLLGRKKCERTYTAQITIAMAVAMAAPRMPMPKG